MLGSLGQPFPAAAAVARNGVEGLQELAGRSAEPGFAVLILHELDDGRGPRGLPLWRFGSPQLRSRGSNAGRCQRFQPRAGSQAVIQQARSASARRLGKVDGVDALQTAGDGVEQGADDAGQRHFESRPKPQVGPCAATASWPAARASGSDEKIVTRGGQLFNPVDDGRALRLKERLLGISKSVRTRKLPPVLEPAAASEHQGGR